MVRVPMLLHDLVRACVHVILLLLLLTIITITTHLLTHVRET
jgi:hypothetical protein